MNRRELAAVVLYGTHTKSPMTGTFMQVNTRGVPVLYVNGDLDGKAHPADTLRTFRETGGGPKAFCRGSRGQSLRDYRHEQPARRRQRPGAPQLPHEQATASIARISGIFLLAHMYDEPSARSYIYNGEGTADPAVSIQLK